MGEWSESGESGDCSGLSAVGEWYESGGSGG